MITLPRKCLWQALNCVRYHTTQAFNPAVLKKVKKIKSTFGSSWFNHCKIWTWKLFYAILVNEPPPTPIICLWWHYLPEYVMAEQCLHLDWMHMVLLRKLYCLTKQSSNLMIPTRWLLKSLGNSVFNSWQTQLDEANRIKDDLTGFFPLLMGLGFLLIILQCTRSSDTSGFQMAAPWHKFAQFLLGVGHRGSIFRLDVCGIQNQSC